MTIFRFKPLWALLISTVAGLSGYFIIDQKKMREDLEFARSSARICGFSEGLVNFNQGRPRQILLGGQELDCETGQKNLPLQCLEKKLVSANIGFRGPHYRGNCTFVPLVP